MEKKLELRHIAPYLPYGLKVRILPLSDLYSDKITFIECLSDEFVTFKNAPDYYFQDDEPDIDFKPLLIPLSELNKQAPSTVSGIRRIDEINSKSSYHIKYKGGETFFDELPERMPIEDVWDTYEQLFANHFDVFNLIDSGLALNKLTTPH